MRCRQQRQPLLGTGCAAQCCCPPSATPPLQIGGALYLWRLSPQMAGATAAVGAALVLVAGTYGAFTRRAQRIYQDALAASNGVAEEGFTLSRLVRAFGTEAATQQRYDASLATLRRISIRQVGRVDVQRVAWTGAEPSWLGSIQHARALRNVHAWHASTGATGWCRRS